MFQPDENREVTALRLHRLMELNLVVNFILNLLPILNLPFIFVSVLILILLLLRILSSSSSFSSSNILINKFFAGT